MLVKNMGDGGAGDAISKLVRLHDKLAKDIKEVELLIGELPCAAYGDNPAVGNELRYSLRATMDILKASLDGGTDFIIGEDAGFRDSIRRAHLGITQAWADLVNFTQCNNFGRNVGSQLRSVGMIEPHSRHKHF